jgi:iron complex transport system substrate-binding protein
MIRTLGALVGATEKAEALARRYERHLADVAAMAANRPRPRVYFEEWDDPLISGIGWLSHSIQDEIVPTHAPTNAVRTASMPLHVEAGAVPGEPQHHGT